MIAIIHDVFCDFLYWIGEKYVLSLPPSNSEREPRNYLSQPLPSSLPSRIGRNGDELRPRDGKASRGARVISARADITELK